MRSCFSATCPRRLTTPRCKTFTCEIAAKSKKLILWEVTRCNKFSKLFSARETQHGYVTLCTPMRQRGAFGVHITSQPETWRRFLQKRNLPDPPRRFFRASHRANMLLLCYDTSLVPADPASGLSPRGDLDGLLPLAAGLVQEVQLVVAPALGVELRGLLDHVQVRRDLRQVWPGGAEGVAGSVSGVFGSARTTFGCFRVREGCLLGSPSGVSDLFR